MTVLVFDGAKVQGMEASETVTTRVEILLDNLIKPRGSNCWKGGTKSIVHFIKGDDWNEHLCHCSTKRKGFILKDI